MHSKICQTVGKSALAAGLALVTGLIGGAGAAQAQTAFDATLPSPGGATPGYYDGSSLNPNGGFTVETSGGLTLGLRAKERSGDSVINSSTNLYQVPTGPNQFNASRAFWNYEFSIHVDDGGNLTQLVSPTITITDITTPHPVSSFNPLLLDNSVVDAAGVVTHLPGNTPPGSSEVGGQNSENLTFGAPVGLSGFDFNAADQYEITLSATYNGSVISDTIEVQAVPEPTTLSLLGAGLLGLFISRRKRRG